MQLDLTSLENNAVYGLISPAGELLAVESTSSEPLFLPHPGEYQIIVGSTRGNASFDLMHRRRRRRRP